MTIQAQNTYTLDAGRSLTTLDQEAVTLTPAGGQLTVRIAGTVTAQSTLPQSYINVVRVLGDVGSGSSFTIEAGGVIRGVAGPAATFSSAVQSRSAVPLATFTNAGLIDVSVTNDGATGRGVELTSVEAFENSGSIVAHAVRGATGVMAGFTKSFVNSGTIEAASNTIEASRGVYATAINAEARFLNTGTVTGYSNNPNLYGVAVWFGGEGVFENRGVISGEEALAISGGQEFNRWYDFYNSGVMNGIVDLGWYARSPGRERFHNSGTVNGDVEFGNNPDRYDGGGLVRGAVHGHGGDDILVGGASADRLLGDEGADTISGGGGADDLQGGAGADSLVGGGGTPVLDGGLGDDILVGGSDRTTMFGGDGRDTITGGGAFNTVYGGSGADRIVLSAGENIVRGDDGDDSITGGSGFDDINGNQGDDVVHGGDGDDWVVGGKDWDLLYGDAGGDIVYGNIGNDTCYGGDGADLVRGGQGDDSISGDAGNDWLSGDRGNDTVSGGAGADTFNVFAGAGGDRVTDFNAAEGDKVRIEGGASYAVRQAGSDTVIDLGGGDTLTLVGVNSANLPAGWIFAG